MVSEGVRRGRIRKEDFLVGIVEDEWGGREWDKEGGFFGGVCEGDRGVEGA